MTTKSKKKKEAREQLEKLIQQGEGDFGMVLDHEPVVVYDRQLKIWVAACTLHT